MPTNQNIFHYFVEKCLCLCNTIKYNWFYIVLSLLVPVILIKMKVGTELIEDLIVKKSSIATTIKIVSIFIGFGLLTFSVWTIPVASVKLWAWFRQIKSKRVKHIIFLELLKVYNGVHTNEKQIPIIYFSLLPWIIFTLTITNIFFGSLWWLAVFSLLVLFIVLLDRSFDRKIVSKFIDKKIEQFFKNRSARYSSERFSLIILSFFLLLLSLLFVIIYLAIETQDNLILKRTLVIAGCISTIVAYVYMRYMELNETIPILETYVQKLNNGKQVTQKVYIRYKITGYVYSACLFICLGLVILLYVKYQTNIMDTSPLFIILILLTFHAIIADLFVTSLVNLENIVEKINAQEIKSAISRYCPRFLKNSYLKHIVYVVLGLYIFTLVFSAINNHKIRKEKVDIENYYSEEIRPPLFDYLNNWINSSDRIIKDNTLTLYLVSGQGGGSRAGAWFYMNMQKLDNLSKDTLSANLFSLSTVSGSTSGAMMYMADKYFNTDTNKVLPITEKTAGVYAKNYISGSLFGLLLGDGIEGLVSTNTDFHKDRNYYMQLEEMRCYSEASGININEAKRFFEQDYLSAYCSNKETFDNFKKLPLFFINTSIIDNGAKAIFSPVKFENHIGGVDIYKQFKEHSNCISDTKQYNIPFITCVNQSQSFPLINAYNYMNCVGRLIDGGAFENSGCGTTLEIYDAIKKFIVEKPGQAFKNPNIKHIRVVCINILNGSISNEYNGSFKPPSLLNSLSAIVNTPFGGHENVAIKKINYRLNNNYDKDTSINIVLNANVSLTKMLSDSTIRLMDKKSKQLLQQLPMDMWTYPLNKNK